MIGYIARRLVASAALLVAASFIIFSFTFIAPGSPLSVLLGGHNVTTAEINALKARYDLNAPFLVQYVHWFSGIITGNFGQSIDLQSPVSQIVGPKILPTVELAAFAGVLVVIFGFLGGVVAAVKKGKAIDGLLSAGTLIGSSVAPYVSALLLIIVFAAKLGWFPVYGLGGPGLGSRIYHLTLPAISLAMLLAAFVGRVTRAAMIDALELDYVDTARSRGMSFRNVVFRHALRSALIPIVTVGALASGYLITGAVVIEYTFALNGLGGGLITAIQDKDYAVVQAIALIFTAVFIAANFIADLLYLVIDPRLRIGGARA